VLEGAWLFTGLSLGFQQWKPEYAFDRFVEAERRRLATEFAEPVALDVAWPRGAFFQPRTLACPTESNRTVLVGSSEGLFHASTEGTELDDSPQWKLTALAKAAFPPGAAVLCGISPNSAPPQKPACIVGEPSDDGIAFWSMGQERTGPGMILLPLMGNPWHLMTGSMVKCEEVAGFLIDHESSEATWCLLLVGCDGVQLPVAVVPLAAGSALPAADAVVSPVVDAPLTQSWGLPDDDEAVISLHIEPRSGRLWATLAGGELQAWELLGEEPKSLGRWRPALDGRQARRSPQAKGTQSLHKALAVCQDHLGGLLIAAHSQLSGPRLFHSIAPSDHISTLSGVPSVTPP